ncbi:unnamed protein product, partial [Allacma fusca]
GSFGVDLGNGFDSELFTNQCRGHRWKLTPTTEVHLKVLPVTLMGPGGEVTINAIMDDGSTLSLIDMDLAKSLDISGPNIPLCMQWTNGTLSHEVDSEVVSLKIRGAHKGSKIFKMNGVRTSTSTSFPMFDVNVEELKEKYSHLADVPFAPLKSRPLLLIGHDNIQLALSRKYRLGGWSDPIASKTLLGWVIHGDIPVSSNRVNEHILFHECCGDDELNRLVKESFSTESFGVQIPKTPLKSQDYKRALMLLESTTVKVGERFQTGLLWRQDNMVLPESRSTALRRLHCLERKMDRDPEFADQYIAKMEDFINKGYAVMVSSPRKWYIPHFPHVNPKKPGKIRLIFDAAAKCEGVSLNSCLLTGPDLLNSLPAVLMRFRENPIAAVGDIQEMFPQIGIKPEDQESQRFLWRGRDRGTPPLEFKMVRMIFGAASSPTSANFVKNKNASDHKEEFPLVYKAIIKNTYVDDHLDGGKDAGNFSTHIKNVIEVYRRGGFFIRNWSCNSNEVLNSIPAEVRASGCVGLGECDERPVESVLGLFWNPNSDTFSFRVAFEKVDPGVLSGEKTPTKRDILRLMMSLYDPLGFLAHFVIKAKIFFQMVWRAGLGWDEIISPELNGAWQTWLENLKKMNNYKIPRCYNYNLFEANSIQLHIFSDASEEAFGSVAYLRIEVGATVSTAFILAKTKVAPLKPLSIPRLELQAAVLAEDLTTSATINALRRFIGRRGEPEDIYSDNGTNFKGASRELREALKKLNEKQVAEIAVSKGINWHFIPPASPHMGGCWERMVRSVKVALQASLHERVPREDVLRTLLVEAESLVNSRPLTFVSVDPDDPESLTPNHFLLGKNNLVSSPGIFTDDDVRLRNHWKFTQRLADYFWCRWVKEFLPTLTRRTKWFNRVDPIQVGDSVVIADPNAARGTWPLAVVIRVFPDRNGQVRFADVRTKDGVYRRPSTKLCVLDVRKENKE